MTNYKLISLVATAIFIVCLLGSKFLSFFPIKHIRIKNQFVNICPQEVRNVLKNENLGNFFIVNVAKIKALIRNNTAWVDDIVVKKVWPDTLEIFLTEKKTLAVFNDAALTTKCEVIAKTKQRDLATKIIFTGPISCAEKMCKFFYDFNIKLAQQHLTIKKLMVDSNNSWNMLLDNNMLVALGQTDVDNKAQSFLRYYNSIIKINSAVNYVDMRYSRGMAIGVNSVNT